ncbi:MAG: phosphatidylserine decarboxylase, partial [Pirellulaceae bacterium]
MLSIFGRPQGAHFCDALPRRSFLQIGGLSSVVVGLLIIWFFRNPKRDIPMDPGMVVSPADGRIVEIEHLEFDEFIGGPAKKIGIF